jgi:hypothetical protein
VALEQARRDVQAVAGASVVTVKSLNNKLDSWKKNFKLWEVLTRLSGFSVVNGVVTAELKALEAYFTAHPEAAKFKHR